LKPPHNYTREIGTLKESPEFLRMLDKTLEDIYNRLGTPVSVTGRVISGGSSGGGGTSVVAFMMAATYAASVGSNTITIPSNVLTANNITSSNYVVIAQLQASD